MQVVEKKNNISIYKYPSHSLKYPSHLMLIKTLCDRRIRTLNIHMCN